MERAIPTPTSRTTGEPATTPPETSDAERGDARVQPTDGGRDTARQLERHARDAVDHGTRKAAEYARAAGRHGRELLNQQKQRAAEQLHTGSEAVRRAAEQFREDGDENIAGYANAAGDEVERAAKYLERRDLGALLRDAESCARRRPEWFLGGMFVAGLAITRFLKASGRRNHDRNDGEDHHRGKWPLAQHSVGRAPTAADTAPRPSQTPSVDPVAGAGCVALVGKSDADSTGAA